MCDKPLRCTVIGLMGRPTAAAAAGLVLLTRAQFCCCAAKRTTSVPSLLEHPLTLLASSVVGLGGSRHWSKSAAQQPPWAAAVAERCVVEDPFERVSRSQTAAAFVSVFIGSAFRSRSTAAGCTGLIGLLDV